MMASFQCVAALTISFMMLSAPVQGSGFPRRPGDATLQTPNGHGCWDAGYTNGCCTGGGPSGCSVRTPSGVVCYCDEACHLFGMIGSDGGCCSDISDIGCFATTCANAGLLPGCCVGTGSQCHTSFGCYCDEACIEYEDCCSDVPRRVNCQNTERVLASQETRPNPGNDDYASKIERIAERLMADATSRRKAKA